LGRLILLRSNRIRNDAYATEQHGMFEFIAVCLLNDDYPLHCDDLLWNLVWLCAVGVGDTGCGG
jgi:hypothetical protein